jgi:hypothetical protein
MNIEAGLESRIRTLEDIEAIKRLKAKYWNSVDTKQWENLAECFAVDAVFASPFLGEMTGRDHILRVLKRAMKNVKTSHQGHNPEIEIIDRTTARGRWALNDHVEMPGSLSMAGYGHYEEDYINENGAWKIKRSKLTYIFQEGSPEVLKSFKY